MTSTTQLQKFNNLLEALKAFAEQLPTVSLFKRDIEVSETFKKNLSQLQEKYIKLKEKYGKINGKITKDPKFSDYENELIDLADELSRADMPARNSNACADAQRAKDQYNSFLRNKSRAKNQELEDLRKKAEDALAKLQKQNASKMQPEEELSDVDDEMEEHRSRADDEGPSNPKVSSSKNSHGLSAVQYAIASRFDSKRDLAQVAIGAMELLDEREERIRTLQRNAEHIHDIQLIKKMISSIEVPSRSSCLPTESSPNALEEHNRVLASAFIPEANKQLEQRPWEKQVVSQANDLLDIAHTIKKLSRYIESIADPYANVQDYLNFQQYVLSLQIEKTIQLRKEDINLYLHLGLEERIKSLRRDIQDFQNSFPKKELISKKLFNVELRKQIESWDIPGEYSPKKTSNAVFLFMQGENTTGEELVVDNASEFFGVCRQIKIRTEGVTKHDDVNAQNQEVRNLCGFISSIRLPQKIVLTEENRKEYVCVGNLDERVLGLIRAFGILQIQCFTQNITDINSFKPLSDKIKQWDIPGRTRDRVYSVFHSLFFSYPTTTVGQSGTAENINNNAVISTAVITENSGMSQKAKITKGKEPAESSRQQSM